jgi:peptidyl-prolyl cis-trans isomerase SurA
MMRSALALVTILSVSACSAGVADRIAAVVGENVILESEVAQGMVFLRISRFDTITPDSVLREEALERLIYDQVMMEQARRDSIVVEQEDIEELAEENVAEVRSRFDTEEEFQEALAAEGLTERSLRARYGEEARRRLLAQRLMEKAGITQTYVSPAEAERFYNEYRDSIAHLPGRVRLAHILVAIRPADDAIARAEERMREVLQLLATGAEFPALARSFSDDSRTAARGGDRGWVSDEELEPELAAVLSQLEPGQLYPVPTRQGYNLVKLEEKSAGRYRFRSILVRVRVTRQDTVRAREKAESLRRQALAGVPFDTLARRYSDDPETGPAGGFLGELATASLSPPFDAVVERLDSGEVSEPVLSEHGFHLLKVLDKQEERMLSYLEMQDRIRAYLQQQQFSEKLEQYLARISQQVHIRRFD